MSNQRANRRALIALSMCLFLGLVFSLGMYATGAYSLLSDSSGVFHTLATLLALGGTALMFAAFTFFWYAFFTLGWFRLRDRQQEFEDLADDNTVGDPEAGERKLNEYLSAITSMEARIGLLQRSAPYIPPERRAPPEMKLPRHRLTPRGRNLVATALCIGALAGVVLGVINGIHTRDLPDATLGFQPVVLARLAVCAALGMLCALPFAAFAAAFNVQVQEPDDAGADRPEAA